MRHLLLAAALACAVPAAAHAADADVETLARAVDAKVIAWRRDIHQHPELGNRETRTAALVADHLRKLGLEDVRTGIATTGVTAVLKGGKPGPRIALRADMDALPVTEATGLPFASKATAQFRGETVGVMHACGHDAHTSILMGVAEALVAMRDELPGEILFVFQPAEEGPPDGEEGGAEEMLRQGIFQRFKPEAVFGLHVFSTLNAHWATAAGADDGRLRPLQHRGAGPADARLAALGRRRPDRGRGRHHRHRADRGQPPPGHLAAAGGAELRRDPRRRALQHHSRPRGDDRHHPHLRRGHAQGGVGRPANVAESGPTRTGASVIAKVPDTKGNPVTVNDPALTARMAPSLQKARRRRRHHPDGP